MVRNAQCTDRVMYLMLMHLSLSSSGDTYSAVPTNELVRAAE